MHVHLTPQLAPEKIDLNVLADITIVWGKQTIDTYQLHMMFHVVY